MRLLEISAVMLAAAASIASATDGTGDGDVALEMSAALEAHAQLPASMPELPDDVSPPRDAPERKRTPGNAREQGLATSDLPRKEALERATDHAANLALEVLGRDVKDGPGATATARAAWADGEAAVGLARGAEARGVPAPLPLWDPAPDVPAFPTGP